VDRADVPGSGSVRCARMALGGCGRGRGRAADALTAGVAEARKTVCSRSPRVRDATRPTGQSSVVSTSTSGMPCARRSWMKSTRMIELRTTMPAPAMKPMAPDQGRGMPNLGLTQDQIDVIVAYLETLK